MPSICAEEADVQYLLTANEEGDGGEAEIGFGCELAEAIPSGSAVRVVSELTIDGEQQGIRASATRSHE